MLSRNLFAYCDNNPIARVDPEGKGPLTPDDMYKDRPDTFGMAPKSSGSAKAASSTTNGSPTSGTKNDGLSSSSSMVVTGIEKVKRALTSLGAKTQLSNNAARAIEMDKESSIMDVVFWFYEHVKAGAEMDYKLKNRTPNWALTKTFDVNGRGIDMEGFGNLNYGYVGAALYIDIGVLLLGGDYAAGGKDSDEDKENIRYGFDLYLSGFGK